MRKKSEKENEILNQEEIFDQSQEEIPEQPDEEFSDQSPEELSGQPDAEDETGPSGKKRKKKFSLKDLKFLKTKKFYIILIIVFSVLLIADIVFGSFFKMTSSFGAMSFGNAASFDTDVSIDADIDADSEISSDDAFASGSDVSGMPDMSSGDTSGMDISGLPDSSGSDSSEDTADDSSDESDSDSSEDSSDSGSADISGVPSGDMSDIGDVSGLPSGDSAFGDISDSSSEDSSLEAGDFSADTSAEVSSAAGGLNFRTWLGSYYLIIALILALLDIAAIVNLVVFSKRARKAQKEALKAQAQEEGRIYIDRGPVKKEKNAKTAWIIPLVIVIIIILIVNLISSGSSTSVAQTQASDLSGTVESGSIDTTIPGAGTLEEEDAVEVSFADGVEVTKWYVSNGDTVSEGDVLAKVDKVTVLSAIADVQAAIEGLDDEIASHEDDSISDTITASASGRVKAVYVSEDMSVVDAMYSYGALAVISLDGLMAVDIETDELEAGDSVTVTLSDGTEEEGTVESVVNGTAVITLTDEDTEIDDSVTVTDSDGNEIGTGTLYVHSALKITGFSGTVSSVSVSKEDEVSSGDTLLTLEDTDYTAEYEALVEQRQELSDQIADLFQLYATGYLYASDAGTVSGIDDDSSADSDSDSSELSDDSDDADSSDDTADADATSLDSAAEAITVTTVNASFASEASEEETEESADLAASEDEEDEDDDSTIVGYVILAETGEESEDEEETGEAEEEAEEDEESVESITVTLATLDGETKTVTITSDRALYTYDSTGFVQAALTDITAGSILFYAADETLPIYVFSFSSSSDEEDESSQSQEESQAETDLSSMLESTFDASDDSEGSSSETASSESVSESTDMSSYTEGTDTLSSDESAAASTEGEVSTTTESVETTYSVSETTLCSITPQDYMTVEITVDELDILSLEVGQSAAVTLDAYVGQSFEGEVISVSLSPENSGGNSKYTAVIQIERTEDMLTGMNASVKIVVDTAEDVLIVPIAALFEEDGLTYIYTAFDEKSGTYSGAVEVTTGVSDGEYVEITEGLSEGDTYYYSCLDTVNYSSTIISGSGGTIDFGSFMQ